ncbi:MAG: thiamine diphosphokinase [Clostridia bacterium]|nr:thiamine diphosphokinase [Clostridia bacterium]
MRCVIFLNGDYTENFEFRMGDHIIACDGAYQKLLDHGVSVGETLGDFDSLGYIPDGASVFPVEKDMTDGELALTKAAEKGFKEIAFISAGGKRDDHFLGNLSLLIKAFELGLKASLYTNYSVIRYLGEGDHVFIVSAGKTVSFITTGVAEISRSEGLKYPFDKTVLKPSSTLGISNVCIKDEISFTVKSGNVFFIINI